jgi:hypothetical protein
MLLGVTLSRETAQELTRRFGAEAVGLDEEEDKE